jgi:uncharacterized protein YabE (DUF348 family)/3D (Asp-Asp-Asp) domain-containing protein
LPKTGTSVRATTRGNTIALILVLVAAVLFMFLAFPVRSVTVDVDGRLLQVKIRGDNISAIDRADLALGPEDRLIAEGDRVKVDRAKTVLVQVDGDALPLDTQAETVDDVLEEAGVDYGPEDTVLYDGFPIHPGANLEEAQEGVSPDVVSLGRFTPGPSGEAPEPPVFLSIRRPETLTISVDGVQMQVTSSRVKVEELLAEAGIPVGPSDYVNPARDGLIGDDKLITVLREKTIFLIVGGELTTLTSFRQTVAELLEDTGTSYEETDIISPGLEANLADNITVSVTHVRGDTVVIDEAIPYETIYREDSSLAVGEVRIVQPGQAGLRHREFSLETINGDESERELIREWVDPLPQDEIIALGTSFDVHTLDTEGDGAVPYVDTLEVVATWYNALCEGCDESTSTQTPLRYGTIAVDPRVIPLGTCLYVPGYGFGRAEDVGGAIKGNRIDLGFPGAADGSWWGVRDVTIYILPSCPDHLS